MDEFLQLLNAFRAQNGLRPLFLSVSRQSAASNHASRMARLGRLFHSSDFGFAENVAAGQSSIRGCFNAWKSSAGHRRNMLGPYRRVGFGFASSRRGVVFYCAQFE